jgi:tetratricopeptide (TPR) repeat protein
VGGDERFMGGQFLDRKARPGSGRWCACLCLGLLGTFIVSSPAISQTDEENRAACADPNLATRLRACSLLIKSGQPSDLNTPVAYNNRGVAYTETGKRELAIQDFNEAIALFPAYAIAYSNRGLAYENSGQNERAVADFDQPLKLNPKYSGAYNNRCYVLAVLGRLHLPRHKSRSDWLNWMCYWHNIARETAPIPGPRRNWQNARLRQSVRRAEWRARWPHRQHRPARILPWKEYRPARILPWKE